MDAFKDQVERVRQQLAALTASQRMLVGLLVAVMAVTVLYWGRYAGAPEMVAVLEQPLSDEDMGAINNRLEQTRVPHAVVAGRVMVPADRKAEVLADLMYSQDLPHDTHSAFEDLSAKELNPFSPQSQRDAVYVHAVELELGGIIRRWPGVADARVVINAKNERHIGESIPPSATVNVRTRGRGQPTAEAMRQLVQSAADGVSGAVSGLTPANVHVIVDGRIQRADPADGLNGGLVASGVLEVQQKNEAFLEQKVRAVLPFIAGLTVQVVCDVENASRNDVVHKYDKAGAFTQDTYTHTQSTDQRQADAAAGEPGAATNAGVAGANGSADVAGGGGGAVSGPVTVGSSNEDTTGSIGYVPSTVSTITTPAGKAIVRTAAVCVPMSYVLRQARAMVAGGKPTEADVARITTAETAKVRELVASTLGVTGTSSVVSVATWADDAGDGLADLTGLAAATAPATSTAVAGLTAHAKEIGVLALALVSLALMVHLGRRGGTASALPTSASLAGFGGLPVDLASLGGGDGDHDDHDEARRSATEGIGSTSTLIGGMEGMELDEDTVRTQQMLDQVSTLVKEDPDAAAALVKRWVSRS